MLNAKRPSEYMKVLGQIETAVTLTEECKKPFGKYQISASDTQQMNNDHYGQYTQALMGNFFDHAYRSSELNSEE
jgi:hypothetical protein